MTTIYVINCSQKTDNEIKIYLNNFVQVLNNNNIDYKDIQFNVDNGENDFIRRSVQRIISSNSRVQEPLLESKEFCDFIPQYDTVVNKIIIVGEKVNTKYPWGDAIPGVAAVIKHVSEKNIWHEVAHIFGAEDHYSDKDPICKVQKDCIMGYGIDEGTFCCKALAEMRTDFS